MKTNLALTLAPALPRAPAAAPPPSVPRPRTPLVFQDRFDPVEALGETKAGRPFAMGRDGFVALGPTGQVVAGQAPTARVRQRDVHAGPLDPLFDTLGKGKKRDVHFQMPGGAGFDTHSNGDGMARMPLDALGRADLHSGVDPRRGGVVSLDVSTPRGDGDESNVLVLPRDYDGPIFISDIDDTLRDTNPGDLATGHTQKPIDGAQDLLQSVADRGVPIVYLSAGPDRIRPQNEDFLGQLPRGILLDRDHLGLRDLLPFGQAETQGDYKAGVIEQLKQAYPNAKLFGLGDDKYGDAMAYTREGARSYIHDVIPGDAHIPSGFDGVITRDYTPEFRARVGADLDEVIARSRSFHE